MRTLFVMSLVATTLVAQSSPVVHEPVLSAVLDPVAAAQFLLPVRGFSAAQLAYSPVPQPALRAGAATLYAPDPLLCSASYAGGELERLVFASSQGAIALLDASPSLALHVLAVPAGTWSALTGVCIDRQREQVVLLDAAQPSLLHIALADLRAGNAKFTWTSLPAAWTTVRGIALDFAHDRIVGLDPATGNLLQHSGADATTYAGSLRPLTAVRSFGFAPSSEGSVDLDLFVTGGDQRMLTDQWTWNTAGVDDETGVLLATVLLGAWVPPCPDSSGLTYDPLFGRMIVTDSEVDEMPIYAGKNVFEASRTGTLARTSATVAYTPEPTGITLDTATRTFYLSDDDIDKIYVVTAGADNLLHTADDSIRSFSVRDFCEDAESLAFDSTSNTLWIAGGAANLVHKLKPGPNGIFDGAAPIGDDVLASYDTAVFGVTNPSGIARRSGDGGLYVIGLPRTRLIQLNVVGQLVRVINLPSDDMILPQGMVFAPSTVGTGDSLFLVDRGVDNNFDPSENDGEMREYGLPAPLTVNQPPVVDAGPDLNTSLAPATQIVGSVVDDGLPNGTLTRQWTRLSGPGTATFSAPTQAVTNVTFSAAGTYTLQLSGSDGTLGATDTVSVIVQPGSVLERTVAASWDDAEEQPTAVTRSSTDLEMVTDGTIPQIVGIRFLNLTIPPGAFITSANVQFTADAVHSGATSLSIVGQADDNAATFQTTTGSISARSRTTAAVAWAPSPWTVVGEAGPNQRTPELKNIVQEIVNRPGWLSGNAMVFVISGSGVRNATSFDGGATLAPKLVVNYQTAAPTNQPPVVSAGPDVSVVIGTAAHLVGSATDDGLPNPLTRQWSKISGPGTVTFSAPTQTTTNATCSLVGSYTLQLSAFDGAYTRTDTCVVTVTEANTPPVVDAGPDVTVVMPSAANLAGTVTDDGLNGPVTMQWSKLSGPGTVTFTAPTAAVTNATFSLAGSYTLQLSANDGALTASDTVVVTVEPQPSSSGTIERFIAIGGDDAEESPTAVTRSSTDLELVVDAGVTQVVGLRFADLGIPRGATISSAYVQFTTDEATSIATQLTIA
ncbi:MAG TPA: hypothetical protein VF384_16115, partial [Planctomycetota bacterium]